MTVATVPDLTGLGNGAESPEDMEEVLHGGGGGGGGGLHTAPPAAVPQPTSFCPSWRTRRLLASRSIHTATTLGSGGAIDDVAATSSHTCTTLCPRRRCHQLHRPQGRGAAAGRNERRKRSSRRNEAGRQAQGWVLVNLEWGGLELKNN